MSKINIFELYNDINQKKLEKYKIYNDILKRCHSKIKLYAKNLKLECFYEIPNFIFGVPLYNTLLAKKYIIDSLTDDGFITKELNMNWIYISWDIKNKKIKKVNNKKNNNKLYKSIDEYNPSGNFIYNESAMNDINEKSKLLFNI